DRRRAEAPDPTNDGPIAPEGPGTARSCSCSCCPTAPSSPHRVLERPQDCWLCVKLPCKALEGLPAPTSHSSGSRPAMKEGGSLAGKVWRRASSTRSKGSASPSGALG